MSIIRNLRLRLKYKKVKFYNLSLMEIQNDVEIGEGSRIGSFSLIQKDVRIGKKCTIGSFCNISSGVRIGDNVSIQTGCHITRGVRIGDGCFIGPGVVTMNSKYMSGDIKPPIIGNYVKIGGGSLILPAVEIGNNVFIGAGSVVTKSIKDNDRVLGNPASVV
jgi:UDP-2-acetamido-3-amino-2,3-dideoxy-glucuronate N-acetyltransferase